MEKGKVQTIEGRNADEDNKAQRCDARFLVM